MRTSIEPGVSPNICAGMKRSSRPACCSRRRRSSHWGSCSVPPPLYALLHEPACAQTNKPTGWAAELHFRTDPALRPLRDAAHRLAELEEWTPLYDEAALAANSVPTFAMVYESDLYVDTHHSLGTSARVGAVRTCLSADHAHYILSAFGPVVFNHLLAMARIEC